MNWLDIVLIVIFALSVIGGVKDGFAKVVIGFIALILAFALGLWFYGAAGAFLLPYVSHKGIAHFAGFALVFVGVLCLGGLTGWLLGKLMKWAGLSWLDRLLGGAFGVLRGFVVAVALVLALMAFSHKPPPQSIVNSRFAPYIVDAAYVCAAVAPREVKDGARESYDKLKEAWRDTVGDIIGKPKAERY